MNIDTKIKILTALFSCDRSFLLNRTINSFFIHIIKYEKNLDINFYFIDSGTPNRIVYCMIYNFKNVFFMNPNDPEYSYGMFWSYLHKDYVLFLEDDRPFINNIESRIIHPNYIEEAILLLKEINEVKGILLKATTYGKVRIKSIHTILGASTICIITSPPWNLFYNNGPAVYKVTDLLSTGFFNSEISMALKFMKKKWFTAFTYKGLKCKNNEKYISTCQTVSFHFGTNTTQRNRRKICLTPLY